MLMSDMSGSMDRNGLSLLEGNRPFDVRNARQANEAQGTQLHFIVFLQVFVNLLRQLRFKKQATQLLYR